MYSPTESTWQVSRAPEALLGAIAATTPRNQNPTTLRGVPRARVQPTEPPPPARATPSKEHRFAKTVLGPALRVPTQSARVEPAAAERPAPPPPVETLLFAAPPAVLVDTNPGFKRPPSRTDLDLGAARQTDRTPRATPPTVRVVDDYIPEPTPRHWGVWVSIGALVAGVGGLAAWLLA